MPHTQNNWLYMFKRWSVGSLIWRTEDRVPGRVEVKEREQQYWGNQLWQWFIWDGGGLLEF